MYLGKMYKIVLKNGRKFEGRLVVIDRMQNLCLDSCNETFDSPRPQRCVSEECKFCMEGTKFWDLVHFTLDTIETIALDSM